MVRTLLTQIENLTGRKLKSEDIDRRRHTLSQSVQSSSKKESPVAADKNFSGENISSKRVNKSQSARIKDKDSDGERAVQDGRCHPGLYLPRSASIFNPFANLRFAGAGDRTHPVLFLRRFVEIARFERMDSRSQLHYFGLCLNAAAATWWTTLCVGSIDEAIIAFKNKYWNTNHQLDLNHRILIGRYQATKDGTMSDYLAKNFQENSFLDNPLPEREFVAAMIAHFPRDVERELRISLVRTIPQLIEILDEIDSAQLRTQQRWRARLGDNARERSEWHPREADRDNKRPGLPPLREQTVKPWIDARRASSPPPSTKGPNFKSREEYVKKGSSKVDKGIGFKKRTVSFRVRDPVKDSAQQNETVSLMERQDDQRVVPSPVELNRPTQEQDPQLPIVMPLAAVSSLSSSDEQKSVEEYTLKVPLQRDGRILLPLQLAYQGLRWQVEALVDTGATISIIAERELEWFARILQDKYGMQPPRGGFFRMIRIRKTNLSGPFQSKIACAYHKANLELVLKISGNEVLTTFHTVYVVKRMRGSFILGADFLREHGANIFYYTLNSAHFTVLSKTDMVEKLGSSTELMETNESISSNDSRLGNKRTDPPPSEDVGLHSLDGLTEHREENLQLSPPEKKELDGLLDKHQELLDGSLGLLKGYTHVIEMRDSRPHKPKSFPVPLKYRQEVTRQLQEMETLGVISKRATEYINPLVVALRANGQLRICLDARAINEKMLNEHAQPPSVDEVLAVIGDRKFFSKIDISRAYWQIGLEEQSRKYTGFLFNGQTYVFNRLPFGLKTASSSFTRALGLVLDQVPHLGPHLIVYLDDVLVCSETFEQHIQHLDQLFTTLRNAGVRLNRDKCQLVTSHVQFLGHDLSKLTVSMTNDTKEAIRAFKAPRNKKQLQSFLGLINWDRRFVPNLSNLTRALENLLKKGVRFQWTPELEDTFQRIKRAFGEAKVLFLIRQDYHFGLETDASCVGLGARLYQFQLANPQEKFTLAYASRSLKPAEYNYTTTEQEGLALAWALNKFKLILTGRTVYVSTDHRALTFLGTCAQSSRRIARWMELFNRFDLRLEHVAGANNQIADQLSRQPTVPHVKNSGDSNTSEESLEKELAAIQLQPEEEGNLADWAPWILQAQRNDPITRQLPVDYPRSYTLRYRLVRKYDQEEETDRVCIPQTIAWEFIRRVHLFLLHFGTDKVAHFVRSYFVVGNLERIVRDVVASCNECLSSKYYTRPTVGDQYFDQPQETGLVTSVDLFGPRPRSHDGNKYVLVLTDLFSKHTALCPLKNQKVETIIDAIERRYIPRRGYVPQTFLTDRGGQFLIAKWKLFAERVGTTLRKTSPYNPQANPVERVMRELGRVLRNYAWEDHESWDLVIPRLETVINHLAHSSTGFPPVALELDYKWYSPGKGVHIDPRERFQLPAQLLPLHQVPFRRRVAPDPETSQSRERATTQSRITLNKSAQKRKQQANKRGIAHNFELGDKVWRRTQKRSDALHRKNRKLFPVYEGPLTVIGSPHPNAHELQWLDGRYAGISNLRQLRPHREARLHRLPTPDDLPTESVELSAEGSIDEEFVAGLTNNDRSSESSCGEPHELNEQHQTWSRLKRSQSHLKVRNCSVTAGEKLSSPTTERSDHPISTGSEAKVESKRITLFEQRLIQDIASILDRWNRALVRHKRRKEDRRRARDDNNDSSSSSSSDSYSTNLQSEIDQIVKEYERALAFRNRYSPLPEFSLPSKPHEVTMSDRDSVSTDELETMENLSKEDLENTESIDQLCQIYRYWYNRDLKAIARARETKRLLIDDILKLRQHALLLEELDRSFCPLEIRRRDRERPVQSPALSTVSPVVMEPTVELPRIDDATSPEHSMMGNPDERSETGDQDLSPSGRGVCAPPTPLATLILESGQDCSTGKPKGAKATDRPQTEIHEVPQPSTSRAYHSSLSAKAIMEWSSDSSEEEIRPPKSRKSVPVSKVSRRERFDNPRDSLARLRNPKTGRFMPEAERSNIGPPGKKQRPNTLPRSIQRPTEDKTPHSANETELTTVTHTEKKTTPRQIRSNSA